MYIDDCNDRRRRGICEHWTINCCIFSYCVRFIVFLELFVRCTALHLFLAFRLQLVNKLELS